MWRDEGTANVGGIRTTFQREHYYRYARDGNGYLWIVAIKPHQTFGDAIANAQFVDRRGDWTTEPVER